MGIIICSCLSNLPSLSTHSVDLLIRSSLFFLLLLSLCLPSTLLFGTRTNRVERCTVHSAIIFRLDKKKKNDVSLRHLEQQRRDQEETLFHSPVFVQPAISFPPSFYSCLQCRITQHSIHWRQQDALPAQSVASLHYTSQEGTLTS